MDKPRIGLPLRSDLTEDGRPCGLVFDTVRRGLQRAGALVIPLAPVQDIAYWTTRNADWPALTEEELAVMEAYLDMVDGLFIPGGYKFCQYDRELLSMAIKRDMPVLGVCLGMQMMSCYGEDAVAFDPIPDVDRHLNRADTYAHEVIVTQDSLLYRLVGQTCFPVNSWHRRCATENAVYRTVAFSDDGIPEAMELPGARFNLGVQWHPEALYGQDAAATAILDGFLAACRG